MAEVAGLVVGGFALASLFDTAVNCFDLVYLGRNFDRDFTTCQFRLEDARTQLYRWGTAVGVKDQESALRVLGPEHYKITEGRLKHI
jgi:hypothetical protein